MEPKPGCLGIFHSRGLRDAFCFLLSTKEHGVTFCIVAFQRNFSFFVFFKRTTPLCAGAFVNSVTQTRPLNDKVEENNVPCVASSALVSRTVARLRLECECSRPMTYNQLDLRFWCHSAQKRAMAVADTRHAKANITTLKTRTFEEEQPVRHQRHLRHSKNGLTTIPRSRKLARFFSGAGGSFPDFQKTR